MAKRRSETTGNRGMRAPKSAVLESLPHRYVDATPRQFRNEGIARLKKRLKMKDYSEPRIYFGCAAVKKNGVYLSNHLQPKSLSNEWYITWNHFHPQLGKRKQVRWRLGINYEHTVDQRLEAAEKVLRQVRVWLENNNNPWVDQPKDIGLLQALDKAFTSWQNKKPRIPKTVYNYDNARKLFVIHSKKYAEVSVKEIKRPEIRSILDLIQEKRGFGNTRYNFIKGAIRALFGEMIELGYIEVNPLADMLGKKKEKPNRIPFTAEEKERIRKELEGDTFYLFPMLVYYSGIRPGEIRRLLVEDVYLDHNVIFLDGKKTKSSNPRIAIIPPPLKHLLEKHIKGASPKWYILGKEDFSPSDKQMADKQSSDYWLAKVKIGLGIDKDMYLLKHTAGDDLLNSDVDINLIKELYGHTTLRMTQKYLKQQKQSAFRQLSEKIKEFGT